MRRTRAAPATCRRGKLWLGCEDSLTLNSALSSIARSRAVGCPWSGFTRRTKRFGGTCDGMDRAPGSRAASTAHNRSAERAPAARYFAAGDQKTLRRTGEGLTVAPEWPIRVQRVRLNVIDEPRRPDERRRSLEKELVNSLLAELL
jgi:hypothetical protein